LKQVNIPGVLFETTAPRKIWEKDTSGHYKLRDTEAEQPSSVDFADVVIEVQSEPVPNARSVMVIGTHVRLGRQVQGRIPYQ
jgi:hypothetical protein